MTTPKLAVVGVGYWGVNHARVLTNSNRCELAYICDSNETNLKKAQQIATDAIPEHDFEKLLGKDIDGIVLATQAPLHAKMALAALDAGKHVLVEKPLALNQKDANQIAIRAKEKGLVAMVGHLLLYHPVVQKLKTMLTAGELGELYYLYASRVNLGKLRNDENALWSFGPHDFSIIDYLLDGRLPTKVSARGRGYLRPNIEDVVFVDLTYPNGELAHVHLSWLDPKKERRLTLVCSDKMVEFDDMAREKLRIYDRGFEKPPSFTEYGQFLAIRHGDVHLPYVQMNEPLLNEANDFIDAITQNTKPKSDVQSGLRVVSILEAAQKSLESDGQPIYLQ